MLQQINSVKIQRILLIIGPLATLVVSPWSNYDPINPIKLLIVTTLAFATLGIIISEKSVLKAKQNRLIVVAVIIFCVAMFSTFFLSSAPKSQQFWGSFGRNTGFLTYFSLILVLCACAMLNDKLFYEKNLKYLFITALPMTFYCLIQVAKLDPIPWSEKYPFGTLGNINFSSAFFGLSSIAGVGFLFSKSLSKFVKFSIASIVIADLGIALSTGSIQGPMIFLSAMSLMGFYIIRKSPNLRKISIPYLLLTIAGIVFSILGLSNKGPFAKFLFAPSIIFRTDYWHAGWKMTITHPVFGVGLDSYGDWYRQVRGSISTLRTGPERIANTAHNIFLDLSSNGGFTLLLAFLFINLLAIRSLIKVWKSHSNIDYVFISIASLWFGYMVMSAISINQVGVGIWGWIFTGALIGYGNLNLNQTPIVIEAKKRKRKSKHKLNKSDPAQSLYMYFFMLIGFVLAFIPLRADANFRSAMDSKNLLKVMSASESLGASAFHRELTLQNALQGGYAEQSREIALKLIKSYPRDYMGWKAIYVLKNSSLEEKAEALRTINKLDPFNPNNTK